MDATEQTAFDKVKADLAAAVKDRDEGKIEIQRVKTTGEKLIDDAATYQRTIDDQKKQMADMAKGIAAGAAGGGGKPAASGAPAAGDADTRSWWEKLKADFDKLYYWPQEPPAKT